MPPRASKEPKGGASAEVHVDAEQKRLQERAYDQGVLSRSRRVCATTLPPTKQMLRADGKDIVKKSSTRRNRYLLIFNCQIALAAAGKMGTLAQLDSRHPVMYIDFPEGRLKLFGTLTFPRNKYMVLKLGNKEALCEDVLESMIVFSESWWVGTAEENPEECKLPVPPSLTEKRHEKYEFSSRAAAGSGGAGGKEGTQEEEELGEEEEEEEPASQRPKRAATRTVRGKRQRYAEDSDADDIEDDDSGSEDDAPRKLPKVQPSSQQTQARQPARQRQQTIVAEEEDEEGGAAAGEVSQADGKGKGKQATLDLFLKKPPAASAGKTGDSKAGGSKPAPKLTAKPRATPPASTKPKPAPRSTGGKRKAAAQQRGGKEGEDVVDLVGSSDEEEGEAGAEKFSQLPSSVRPQRAAAGAAAKRLRIESDSDEEEEGKEARGSAGEGASESGGESSKGHGSDEDVGEGSEQEEASEGEGPSQEESDYQPCD